MIIIGEKINGAIPSIKKAIAEHDEALIVERTLAQANAGADFLDCAPSTATDIEYETMVWLIGLMQGVTQTPLCIDSPNAKLLARILEEGHVARPGMVNSVNEEGDKCETIFPLIAGTPWHVVGLTCDRDGIPADPEKKIDIAKRIIDKADKVRWNSGSAASSRNSALSAMVCARCNSAPEQATRRAPLPAALPIA